MNITLEVRHGCQFVLNSRVVVIYTSLSLLYRFVSS